MSTIVDTDKIDLITRTSNGDVKLIMVEVRPWENVSLLEIQEKFHTYLDFIEGGHLVRQYPDAQGARLIIRLDTVETPPTEMSIFFDVVQREWLSPAGIGFELGKFIID